MGGAECVDRATRNGGITRQMPLPKYKSVMPNSRRSHAFKDPIACERLEVFADVGHGTGIFDDDTHLHVTVECVVR